MNGFSLNLSIFTKSIEKIQGSLQPENNEYFTRRCMHICDNISLSSSYIERRFRWTLWRNQNTCFISNDFFRKSCRLWDNLKKHAGARGHTLLIVWHMRFACRITKATHTLKTWNSNCISTNAPHVYMYVVCLVRHNAKPNVHSTRF